MTSIDPVTLLVNAARNVNDGLALRQIAQAAQMLDGELHGDLEVVRRLLEDAGGQLCPEARDELFEAALELGHRMHQNSNRVFAAADALRR